jgi:predicted transposase YdaD
LVRYQAFVRERALHDEVTEKAQARAEGKAEGKIEGRTDVLRRQLQVKFGQLPATVEQRLQAANETELITWTERVLFAERLEQVFEG